MSIRLRTLLETIKLPESIRIPFFAGFWYDCCNAFDNYLIRREEIQPNPLNKEEREENVIVSLTSYPARIQTVWLVIKSLLNQTYKPDRIILWLAEEQFPVRQLPQELLSLERYGLEIKWTKDYYGHKKYLFPVREQQKNEVVITYDDDIIYSPKSVERLMKKHKEHPLCLVCERGQAFDDKSISNPGRWKTISDTGVKIPTFSLNPSPGGGCLIPYGGFYKDATNEERFRKLAYKNDDLWYMFMCAENGTRMIKTRKYHRIFSVVHGSQVEQMATENVGGDRNIRIMQGLIEAYPLAWSRIVTNQ